MFQPGVCPLGYNTIWVLRRNPTRDTIRQVCPRTIFDAEKCALDILNFLKHGLNMIDKSKGEKEAPDIRSFRRRPKVNRGHWVG